MLNMSIKSMLVAGSIMVGTGLATAASTPAMADSYRSSQHGLINQSAYTDVTYNERHYHRYFDGQRSKQHRFRQRHYNDRGYCVPPRRIYRRLSRLGFIEFFDLRLRPRVIKVKAVTRRGLTYALKIARCSGILIRAQLLFDDYGYKRPHVYKY